jgi:hypothetical protein
LAVVSWRSASARPLDGVEPGRQRVATAPVLDAQFPQVLEHCAQLLAILRPVRVERAAQTLEGRGAG